jgi:hypothetical protein
MSDTLKKDMNIHHTVGENQALYEKYGVKGSQHIPETEQLCEVIRSLTHPPDDAGDEPRIYPCAVCGVMRTKSEGGTTFTVCDKCWDKQYKPAPSLDAGEWRGHVLDQFEEIPSGGEFTTGGAQLFDGHWYIPRWGCDTLDHILDYNRRALWDGTERRKGEAGRLAALRALIGG